ncbi:MAG: DUF3696 domain-containing protein [Candidatus Methanofastidiosia archaeon]
MLNKIRIQNFKCLQDTKDIEIRPITFLVGPNSSGKSSIFQALLALKQTVESSDQRSALILQDYVDLGSYKDIFFKHDIKRDIIFDFESIGPLKYSVTFSVQEEGKAPGRLFVKSFEFSAEEASNSNGISYVPNKLNLIKSSKQKYTIEYEKNNNINKIPNINLKKFYIIIPEISKIDDKYSALKKFLMIFAAYEEFRIISSFSLIKSNIEDIFHHIFHIGPLRHEPERVYSASGAYPESVGKYGQRTIDIILYEKKIKDKIKKWLEKFNISLKFSLEELKKGSRRYEALLKDYFTKTEVNLADVGFGTSQILPILVQGFLSPSDAILLLEQPEIHLHPKAQCTMGDLLVDIVKNANRKLIIETHSDLLIDRVCKHILLKDSKISPDDIIIYYFDPSKEGTIIKPITINENAQYENFPEGFFEERFEEAMHRAELMQ